MRRNIHVIYCKGVLKPLSPLNIPDNTELLIQIIEEPIEKPSDADKTYQVLTDDGLIRPVNFYTEQTISDSDRQKAAQAYGKIGSLSELIIAERDD